MKNKIIIILAVIVLFVAGVLFFTKNISSSAFSGQPSAWTPELQLEYANVLLAKGLNTDAAQAFEVYIKEAQIENKELASICNKLGNLYMDLKEYEKALANFYKSELLDSNASYKQEMNQSIVQGLENLGLSQQAQYELESRTAIKPPAQKAQEVVIRIGKREITMGEIDTLINNFPEQVRAQLNNDDAKLKFIREYATSEVLYEKGRKLGIDRNSRVRLMVEDFKKKIVLQEMLSNEVEKELKITPEDTTLYYQAHKDQYYIPEKAKVAYLQLSDLAKSNETAAKLKQGKGQNLEEWIERGAVILPNNLGESKEAIENIFKLQKGEIVNPVKINDKFYMFMINEKQPSKEQSLEEVKPQVQEQYRRQKQQQIVDSLVNRMMEQQEVKILFQPKKTNEQTAK